MANVDYGNTSIAMSADGTKIITDLYISTNSGTTWSPRTDACGGDVAMSANGMTIVTSSVSGGSTCVSTDSGVTWTIHAGIGSRGIAVSADGTKMIVAKYGGYVYTSNDSGANWVQQTASGTGSWQSAAISDDGKTLMVGDDWGPLLLSRDSGATWQVQAELGEVYWYAIDIAGDGKKMVAAGGFKYPIYIGTVEGAATAKFDLSTLPTASQAATEDAIKNASLSATSETCYNFEGGSVTTLSGAGVTAPASEIKILGGVAYKITCTTPGGSSDVELALGAHYADVSKLRAYKTSGATLTNITDQVTFTNKDVSGSIKTVISYHLVDGGAFDEDKAANSTIVDPIYIGEVVGASLTAPTPTGDSLASTGFNVYALTTIAATLLTSAVVVLRKAFNVHKSATLR